MTRWGLVTEHGPTGNAWLCDPMRTPEAAQGMYGGAVANTSKPVIMLTNKTRSAFVFESFGMAAGVSRLLPKHLEFVPVEIPLTLVEQTVRDIVAAALEPSFAGVPFDCTVLDIGHQWAFRPEVGGLPLAFYCQWCAAHLDPDAFREWGEAMRAWVEANPDPPFEYTI